MVRVIRLFYISLLITSHIAIADDIRVAVIGDNISTGSVSHPDLAYKNERLLSLFSGHLSLKATDLAKKMLMDEGFFAASDFRSPVSLPLSSREFDGALGWIVKQAQIAFFKAYLDVEEYSWGYFVGRMLGAGPNNLLIAAENGARIGSAVRQIDRVLDHTGGVLPNHLFIFYTGFDLCAPSLSFVTTKDRYKENLRRAFDYIQKNGVAPSGGTDVWVLDPIGLLQLVQSEALLKKTVEAHGKKMSCKELHNYVGVGEVSDAAKMSKYNPQLALIVQTQLPKSPNKYCPTVFGRNLEGTSVEDARIMLANRLRNYRNVIGEVVEEYGKIQADVQNDSTIRFHHIKETRRTVLDPEDVANDCFNLSLEGQMKLADIIKKVITSEK